MYKYKNQLVKRLDETRSEQRAQQLARKAMKKYFLKPVQNNQKFEA
jgi:hypothetical protein